MHGSNSFLSQIYLVFLSFCSEKASIYVSLPPIQRWDKMGIYVSSTFWKWLLRDCFSPSRLGTVRYTFSSSPKNFWVPLISLFAISILYRLQMHCQRLHVAHINPLGKRDSGSTGSCWSVTVHCAPRCMLVTRSPGVTDAGFLFIHPSATP